MRSLAGRPVLWHVLTRVRVCSRLDGVVLATTALEEDQCLVKLAEELGVPVYRGSEEDVLDRYYQAARRFSASAVVRITADCPLIDPDVVGQAVQVFQEAAGRYDYVSNTVERTFPDGQDVEVLSFQTLERAWKSASLPSEREHVTPYVWKHPERFRIGQFHHDPDLSHLRWTLDEPADLVFLQAVYDELWRPDEIFGVQAVLALLARRPELQRVNAHIPTNEGYMRSLRVDRLTRPAPSAPAGGGRPRR